MRTFLSVIMMTSVFGAGCALDSGESDTARDDARDDRTAEEGAVSEAEEAITQAGIQYHNGPVMLGTVGIYLIWYGNWGSGKQIIVDFANNLNGSGWWNINTTYTDGANKKLSNAASLLGQYQYTGTTYSKSLSDSDVEKIVTNTVTKGYLPKSTNAVYVVLTSSDVDQVSSANERFGDYCGWHTAVSVNSSWIKYAWVGNAALKAAGNCIPNNLPLNSNLGVDGMISHFAHELTEAATDPLGNAWYDANGDENADKCSWDHGQTLKTTDGAMYNMVLGGRKFLVQRNWVNAGGGYCAQSYSATDLCPSDAAKTQPGLCGCGKKEPYNVASFKDAQGYSCADWKNYNCRQAQEQYGYTAAQEAAILANCSSACGVCPSN